MHRIAIAAALAGSLLTTATPAAAAPATETWTVDVSATGTDDTNVTVAAGALELAAHRAGPASADAPAASGIRTTAPHALRAPASVITAAVDADQPPGTEVHVDVRGRRADGTWSEWTPTPARLPEPARLVQARIVLLGATTGTTAGAGPRVRGVRLTAEPTTRAVSREPRRAPLELRVFATREGLVGGTTANGHVIVERDHFVALPSRRGLSPRGTGDYSVRVCAPNGRCAWAPVWDVGPWNTRDDYWNPADVRQMWQDLPHGVPQAQAAHQDGYNGGRDQFGRDVRNPAGIDLADGTFWDALELRTNAWVTVTYLWTGAGAHTGTVATGGIPLHVRDAPGTGSPPVGLAGDNATVHVECAVAGQPATGTQGSSDRWLRVAPGKYVAKAYVALHGEVPDC